MQRSVRRRASVIARETDYLLILTLLLLMGVGILMVYSSSTPDAYEYYDNPLYYLERELIWAGLGFVALIAAARTGYQHWQRFATPIFFGTLLLLALSLLPGVGHASHGASRWVTIIPGAPIEPSELMKLALVIYLATWLPSRGAGIREARYGLLPCMLLIGIIAAIIDEQPDLGTAIVVTATGVAVVFVAGARIQHIVSVLLGISAVAWIFTRHGYRQGRLEAFLNPWSDPTGVGYHTIHALLALRSGGLTGVGLGNSVQKWVLPAPHTDSILAVIGEEFGLVGTLFVLALFVILAVRGMQISTTAPDAYGKLLATGITCWISFQALMNIAVITSSVPFTGVPLPFVSYGGTSLVITMTAMGILLNISRHTTGKGFARHDRDHGRGNGRTPVPRVVHHSPSARRLERSEV